MAPSLFALLYGAGGIRPPYLLTASQTFSRLNYSPTETLSNLAENDGGGKSRTERKDNNWMANSFP